jgi:hypothetical protein
VNGSFDSDLSGWTQDAPSSGGPWWSWVSGVAFGSPIESVTPVGLRQTTSCFVPGECARLQFDVPLADGNLDVFLGGFQIVDQIPSTGTYTYYIIPEASSGEIAFVLNLGAEVSVDNVTFGPYTPTLGSELLTNPSFASDLSGWTNASGEWVWFGAAAIGGVVADDPLTQDVTVVVGNSYAVSLEIASLNGGPGGFKLAVDGVEVISEKTALGTYTASFVALDTTATIAVIATPGHASGGAVGSASVKQIT